MLYEKKVIVYIDLLGFKDFIYFTQKTANRKDDKIKAVYDLFRFLTNILDPKSNPHSITKSKVISHFSDLIVISFSPFEFECVYDEIKDIQILIANLISSGFFCRGSIIYGEIIHTPEIIFGPGLIEAYDLEKLKSKFPRVVIDSSIVRDLLESKPENASLDSVASVDQDGEYYVDYFKKVRPHLDDDKQYEKYLICMTKLLLGMSSKPNLRGKLEWIFPKYIQMLVDINFVNREELLEYGIADLGHIYTAMNTEW
jgi:hypothetical protein